MNGLKGEIVGAKIGKTEKGNGKIKERHREKEIIKTKKADRNIEGHKRYLSSRWQIGTPLSSKQHFIKIKKKLKWEKQSFLEPNLWIKKYEMKYPSI